MMTSLNRVSEALQRVHAELAAEHREIGALIAELGRTKQPKPLVDLLEVLHGKLAAHFAREQGSGGYYDVVGMAAPRFTEQVRELTMDHARILSAVQDTIDRARKTGTTDLDELLLFTRELEVWLTNHEVREGEVAREASATVAS